MHFLQWSVRSVMDLVYAWREQVAIRGLDPRDIPDAQRGLRKIKEEAADYHEGQDMIRELCDEFRKRIQDNGKELAEEAENLHGRRIREFQARVLAPDFPVDLMSVDHSLRIEKAKALYNTEILKDEIQRIPEISNGTRVTAFFLMALSYIGNYLTLEVFMGSDFLGSEALTLAVSAGIAAVLTCAECVSVLIIGIFLGRHKIIAMKIIGFGSAVALLLGFFYLVVSRTELGAVAVKVPMGFVQ